MFAKASDQNSINPNQQPFAIEAQKRQPMFMEKMDYEMIRAT